MSHLYHIVVNILKRRKQEREQPTAGQTDLSIHPELQNYGGEEDFYIGQEEDNSTNIYMESRREEKKSGKTTFGRGY